MNNHDESRLADRRDAFLNVLPVRAEAIGRRLNRFRQSGWDINGVVLAYAEARRLGAGSAEHGVPEPEAPLHALSGLLREVIEQEQLPDAALGERLCALAQSVIDLAPPAPPVPVQPGETGDEAAPADDFTVTHFVLPPVVTTTPTPEAELSEEDDIWGDGVALFGKSETRSDDARPTARVQAAPAAASPRISSTRRAATATASVAQAGSEPAAPRQAAPARVTASAPAKLASPAAKPAAPAASPIAGNDGGHLVVPPDFRLYHLTGYGALSLELDQRLEAQGLEVELLEDVAELNELLSALPADLVLIDASFSAQLESIGAAVRKSRASNSKQRLLLVAIAEADDIALRLSARRAGVDALIVDPPNAAEVLRRLQMLVDPEREDAFRVLIVEDDRSQALFAEGILRNAGMDSLVVIDALDVMPALKQFRPDLILMDLNMPGANGIELTALIREQEAFAHTPIVFLSGESSEDLQFDAIDAGGDDFLSKPIRPRHLISAVQTRVRRHRQQENRRVKRPDKDAATGLVYRKSLLEQLEECLQQSQRNGGLIFIEVESLGLLRERIGLTALEILLGDVSRLLTRTVGELPATRFGDGSYLLLDRQREELSLDSLATQIRQILMQTPFQALGHPLRLRLSVGVCAFKHDFSEAGAMINAVEKVAREARAHERGVRRYEPPRAAEALKEAALVAQVREAIDQESLVMLYQPVVAVAGNDVSQYQVLLRLRDAAGKLRSASEIIPVAERTSLIVEIDRWVMLRSLDLIQERADQGQLLRLFVTQSPLTLGTPGQAEWLQAELERTGVPGSSLVLELRLEDVAVHAASVRQFCETLVPQQVQFCLSQFEAGSDAEALTAQLPLGFVKLARKYTTGSISPTLRDELKALIDRAHRRNLQVIGHGVEDAQSAATLWMSGIDFIQGNLVQQADQDLNFDFHQAVL